MKKTTYYCDHTGAVLPENGGQKNVNVVIERDNNFGLSFGPIDLTDVAFEELRERIKDAVNRKPDSTTLGGAFRKAKPLMDFAKEGAPSIAPTDAVQGAADPEALGEIAEKIDEGLKAHRPWNTPVARSDAFKR